MHPQIPNQHSTAQPGTHNSRTELAVQVAIIGGGSAGACCALALRHCGVSKITVIEASNYDQFRIGESIPPESKQLMLKLGIWHAFLAENHEPCYGSYSWWGDERRGYNDSLLNPLGHGWHLDRVKFNLFLAQQAQAAQVNLLSGYKYCHAASKADGGYRLKLVSDSHTSYLNADFVIDATGSKGYFAKSQGSRNQFSAPLLCSSQLYEILDDNHPLTGLTHLEAVASGWWYAARLPYNKMIISHNTDSATFRKLHLNNQACWHDELQRATNTRLLIERAKPLDIKPGVYSAPSFVLDKMIGEHWLAVGDAASSYDTVTSQGIIKSMRDGIWVAQCVADYLQNKDYAVLEHYQSVVRAQHHQYRQMRDYFYLQERRFTDQSFWNKMHNLHNTEQACPVANS